MSYADFFAEMKKRNLQRVSLTMAELAERNLEAKSVKDIQPLKTACEPYTLTVYTTYTALNPFLYIGFAVLDPA